MRGAAPRQDSIATRALAMARVDLEGSHPQPSAVSLAIASAAAIAGSILADAALVAIATRLFPATKGYPHFRFGDYTTLTVVGVAAACVAWPITTRISSAPRWLFFRLAVAVTVLLWAPDAWILARGQSAEAVGVLAVMHVAVAVVTYNCLVRIAPVPPVAPGNATQHNPAVALPERRGAWLALAALVAAEAALGIACLVAIPISRGNVVVPRGGGSLYLLHAAIGAVLGAGAVAMVALARGRVLRACAVIGIVGVSLGLLGGILTVSHAVRLVGIGLMLVGSFVAVLGYLMPAMGSASRADAAGEPRDEGGSIPGAAL